MGQKSISLKDFLTEVPNIRFIAFDTIFTLNTHNRKACMHDDQDQPHIKH